MNRKLLKDNAKIALKQNFWLVMLVVLVAQFMGISDAGAYSSGGYSGGYSGGSSSYDDEEFDFEEWLDDIKDSYEDDISLNDSGVRTMTYENTTAKAMPLSSVENIASAVAAFSIGIILLICMVAILISCAISIFFTYPVQVGYRRFFMLNRSNRGKFSDLFSSFCPKYLNIVKGMFTTNLIIFAWTLLFIIPGIIKSYQYFFVPFILSENPNMSGERAREISTKMTDGYKFEIFVLGLSFLGWSILAALISIPAGLLTCCFLGIGAYLIYTPLAGYMGATYAELYEERREYALYNHLAHEQELCGYNDPVQS